MTSNYKKINLADIGKALLITFAGAFLLGILVPLQNVLSKGEFPTFASITHTVVSQAAIALSITIAYLIQKYFQNSRGQMFKQD